MSDTPQDPGWWLASDGKYYPPQPPTPPSGPPVTASPPEPGQPWAPPTGPAIGVPGAPPVPSAPSGPTSGGRNGAKVVLVVLGLVVALGVFAVVAIAAVVMLARSDTAEQQAGPGSTAVASPSTIGDEPANGIGDPTVPSAQDGDVVVTESGFTTGEGFDGELAANAGAVLENRGANTAAFFEVVFTFTDGAGGTVGTETAYVYAVEPGGTAHAAVDAVSLQGPATAVEATVVIGDGPGLWTGTVVPVEVGEVVVDEFFGLEVRGVATNPTTEAIQAASVQCVVRNDGRIVGGASAVLDTIVPGGEVTWEAITFSDWLRGDSAECSGGTYD